MIILRRLRVGWYNQSTAVTVKLNVERTSYNRYITIQRIAFDWNPLSADEVINLNEGITDVGRDTVKGL